jgi:hypothetical protein
MDNLGVKMKTLTKILSGISLGASLLFNSCDMLNGWQKLYNAIDEETNNHLEWDGNYPGIVIFAYDEEPMIKEEMKRIFDELKEGSTPANEYEIGIWGVGITNHSVEGWYKLEATKYNKKIDIPLSIYSEQIKIPNEFINQEDNSVKLTDFSKYLRENYKLDSYDFISIILNNKLTSSNEEQSSYADKSSSSFIINNVLFNDFYGIKGNQYFVINKTFAHEFAHLLGAKDKYNEHDPKNIYDEKDIMKNSYSSKFQLGNDSLICSLLDEDIIISKPTAQEIGWVE